MQCIAFDSHKHYTRRWFRMRRGRCCEKPHRDMNPADSLQRNQRFRCVPAGRDVIRDTSPEQPNAAWTATELACSPYGKHGGSSSAPNS